MWQKSRTMKWFVWPLLLHHKPKPSLWNCSPYFLLLSRPRRTNLIFGGSFSSFAWHPSCIPTNVCLMFNFVYSMQVKVWNCWTSWMIWVSPWNVPTRSICLFWIWFWTVWNHQRRAISCTNLTRTFTCSFWSLDSLSCCLPNTLRPWQECSRHIVLGFARTTSCTAGHKLWKRVEMCTLEYVETTMRNQFTRYLLITFLKPFSWKVTKAM